MEQSKPTMLTIREIARTGILPEHALQAERGGNNGASESGDGLHRRKNVSPEGQTGHRDIGHRAVGGVRSVIVDFLLVL